MANLSQVGRRLGLTSLTIGAAAGLIGMGALAALRLSLPRTDGTLRAPGLADRVEVLRDRWGVPHIYATSNSDLFAALGYVHAQDRLWQMELNRCTGHGQLAELFGEAALDSDRFARVLGFGRLARLDAAHLDEQTRAIIEAYIGGINAFLITHSNRLPLEFTVLRHQPRPWQLTDVLVWSKVIAYMLSVNWTLELLHARLVAAVGEERARELMLHYPASQPVTMPHNVLYKHGIGEEALTTAIPRTRFPNGHHYGEGSNAWVVSGRRSVNGRPLLASDPHLAASLPALWYEAHLEGGDYKMSGATFPGAPGVVIGHNAHIAWGVTNAMIDVQDLYIERFHPDDPLRYEWCGEWQQAELFEEEIIVRGRAEPVVEAVRITRHGPVISPIAAAPASALGPGSTEAAESAAAQQAPAAAPEALALRWTALESSRVLQSTLALNRARNWHEFRAALALWDTPPQNFIYADIYGHYGYALAGLVPRRAQGDGRLPMPGWDGSHEWTGYIPADALPAAYDPTEGMAISANNRISDKHYAYDAELYGEWMNGYRASRIRELLQAMPYHDVQTFAEIQLDQCSLPGLELAQLVADLPLSDSLEIQARDLLVGWDGQVSATSTGATIYAALRYHLERQAYLHMGDLRYATAGAGLFQVLPGGETLNRRSLPGILERIAAAPGPERADPWLGPDRSWNDVLRESLHLAVAELRQRFGADLHTWRYGRSHLLSLRHVLGRSTMLAPIFNRGDWPIGGDLDTVCMGHIPRDTANGPVYVVPLYRQICDTSDWDASVSVLIGGQSGHPASKHYSDLTALWLRGEYHPMLWSRSRVEQHTVATLVLEPE